jgi:dTDP-4-dehydrorhamnose reductase
LTVEPILLFGADGQLGHELHIRARQLDIPLCRVSHSAADIADLEAVRLLLSQDRFSLVVNAAGYTKVDQAESEPEAAFRSNNTGPGVLARACAEARLPLIHISTDYVFDGSKPSAYIEEDPISPLGVYGRSKAAGEEAVRQALDRHLIIRTSWVYGAYGANFLKTILRLARERNELRVVVDQRGCPTATIDIADAILTITPIIAAGAPVFGTYHFAGSGATTWHGFAVVIVEAQAAFTGRRPEVVPINTSEYPTVAQRPANSELDSTRFGTTFGIRAADWQERTRELVSALLGKAEQGGLA